MVTSTLSALSSRVRSGSLGSVGDHSGGGGGGGGGGDGGERDGNEGYSSYVINGVARTLRDGYSSILGTSPRGTGGDGEDDPSSDGGSKGIGWRDSLYVASNEAVRRLHDVLGTFKDDEVDDPNKEPSNMTTRSDTGMKAPKFISRKSLFQNPYQSVVGRGANGAESSSPGSSAEAVRSLLTIIPEQYQQQQQQQQQQRPETKDLNGGSGEDGGASYKSHPKIEEWKWVPTTAAAPTTGGASRAETASRLAEGTLRALRDLTLDEAVELHSALRFWTERWERPVLSYVEAGPTVWFSEEGYNHQLVGQRVSQIQAVLARRCAAIGGLQQHLMRAGWQRGVAQWGVLGQGGEWAAVAGGDGRIDAQEMHSSQNYPPAVVGSSGEDEDERLVEIAASSFALSSAPIGSDRGGGGGRRKKKRRGTAYYGYTNLFVKNTRGGRIQSHDPALAAWSVDAMRVVRDQLYRASSDVIELPYSENWVQEKTHFNGEVAPNERFRRDHEKLALPLWATCSVEEDNSASSSVAFSGSEIEIADLQLMASEVGELLTLMEAQMAKQKSRRLVQLEPPPRMRRDWYMAALGFPAAIFIAYKLLKDQSGIMLAKEIFAKVGALYTEHVGMPLDSIFRELFSKGGREDVTDKKARMDAIQSLKNMIRSWLDETFPTMPSSEKTSRANSMDMSLIEQRKEENIKSLSNISSVVRMSLIEMQFIKKELMNALAAMDELMGSNEINMRLAAMTPAVIVLYGARYCFRFLYYALLKLGKSKEETYGSFRHVILDIERLLVMRDNPPLAPPPLPWGEKSVAAEAGSVSREDMSSTDTVSGFRSSGPCVLNTEDLGMLMLHVHECRTILWQDRRRFPTQVVRNVAEDLAELAGERGTVSVQQQLQIITRMCRTYSFLKVVSTGIPFDLVRG